MSQKLPHDVLSEHPPMPEQSSSDLLTAIAAAVEDEFEVLDVLAGNDEPAVLCRDIRKHTLAVLRSQPNRKPGEELSLSAIYELDASVPAPPIPCHLCGATTDVWVAPCGNCGASISGTPAGREPGRGREELFDEARKAAAGHYELVGDMEVGKNVGLCYFGWRLSDGRLAAVRLERRASSAHSDSSSGSAFTLHAAIYRQAGHEGASQPGVVDAGAKQKECPQCGSLYDTSLKFCPTDGAALRASSGAGDLIGEVIADRYLILRKLDEGGMGHVYLAEHVRMKRKSAVKVMNPRLALDTAAVTRFVREAASASRVVHPNVATIFDFGETKDGLIYLAMEYVEGQTLQRLIEEIGPLPVARAAEILTQVADGLSEAHGHGIIHRDLKPRNIMIGHDREGSDCAKIVDFGIAKAVDHEDSQITVVGSVVGTPDYMSPEQLGGSKLDARSDIYSLGLIAYNMLTGLVPFPRATSKEALITRLTERPKSLALVRPEIEWPPQLQSVLDVALATEPQSRYATARDFARAFSDAVASMAPAEEPTTGATTVVPARGATRARADRTPTPIPAAATAATTPTEPGEDVLRDIAESIPRPGTWQHVGESVAGGSAQRRNLLLLGLAAVAVLAVAGTLILAKAHPAAGPARIAAARPDSTLVSRTARETTTAAGTLVQTGKPAAAAPVHATAAAAGNDSAGAAASARRKSEKAAEARATRLSNAEQATLDAEFDETRAQILKARLAWKNDGDYEKALPILKYLQTRLRDLASDHPGAPQIGAFRREVDDLLKQVRTGCGAIATDPDECK